MAKRRMTRKVALIGETRTGKTLFAVMNSDADIYAIDPEYSVLAHEEEVKGELLWPASDKMTEPLQIEIDARLAIPKTRRDTAILVDSVTAIWDANATLATMAGKLTPAERKVRGLPENAASMMQAKAEAIRVLGGMASHGRDLWLIWHEGLGLDMDTYKMVKKESISKKERLVILRNVDVILRFAMDGAKYTVTVDPETRGRGTRQPRVGFTIADPPGNYWKGTMAMLEDLIYNSHFKGQESAFKWARSMLNGTDEGTITDLYADVKEQKNPQTSDAMWFEWVQAVHRYIQTANGPSKNERPNPDPVVVPPPPPAAPLPEEVPEPEPETVADQGPPAFTDNPEIAKEAAQITAALEDIEPSGDVVRVYSDRDSTPAAEEDWPDYDIYVALVGRLPFERKMIYNARDVRLEKDPNGWKLPDEEEE